MYVKVTEGAAQRYSVTDLRRANPQVSFPQDIPNETLFEYGVYPLNETAPPKYNPATSKLIEGTPVQQGAEWVQVWNVVPLSENEQQSFVAALQADIVAQTQARLDAFARTRNYDGILSACTYATSTVPRFASDGKYCVDQRDATWSALYAVMAEVQAGTRPMPVGFADVEPLLPDLVWPV